MKDLLIEILESFYPAFLQGTLNANAQYPESFFTFWIYDSEDAAFYDNIENRSHYYVTVIFYSSDPALVKSVPAQARAALKSAGFIPQGRGNDIISDIPTHTGWAIDYIYKENL